MPKYRWEAKPPITRTDLYQSEWEIGTIEARDDEDAIAWLNRVFDKNNISPQQITLYFKGRLVRQRKV